MEIILVQDVPKLGYRGDVVKVKDGYARNYLIPNGYALTASPSNRKMQEENQRQASHKLAKVKEDAISLSQKIEQNEITIPARSGTSGKIFGSITTLQIAQALKDKGFDIDRRKITLQEEIKNIGTYHAVIDLHKEVKAKVNLNIVAEGN
ncbi:MAG: 50S ribosomal protein L9 [Bacteroidota bacterium]|nr:50S ribosomal protein L9 [Bacteroidota bacterium]